MMGETTLRLLRGGEGGSTRESDPRVAALRAGDPAVVEAVLAELLPRVRGWLFRLLGPGADLDDATQEALAELAGALPRFEGRSALSTLAHTITVRTAWRWFGRRRREVSLELAPVPEDAVDPQTRAMGREALRKLYRCLDKLPGRRRVAFVLCAVEGLSPAEAAEVAGVSGTAMRSRLAHARAELARMLRSDPYFAGRFEEETP